MLKDSKWVWVIEYLIGIGFLVAVLPYIINPQAGWSPAHGWAYLLFIACAGIALISSASGTRQRIELSKRIAHLQKTIDDLNQNQPEEQPKSAEKKNLPKQFVGSVN